MINNGGKSGGNPYHDENGHFTSKGNQGSAQPKSDPIVDFNRSLWDMYFGGQPQMPKKKTTGEKVLNQMGLTNEEVMKKHEEMSDEKALNDLGDKMEKLESHIENEPKESQNKVNLDFLNKLEPQDAEVIKKGINAIINSYKNNPDVDFSTLNRDWGEELMYALVYDVGIPEEQADDLVDKFSSVAPTWEETVGKKYGQNDIDEQEYDDIDADYERSYGPVNSPEKYEAYQKWLENGHSFDNIGGENENKVLDQMGLDENDNPKYDYIKLLNDGEDAEITIPIELPVYNDGQGGEESEVNFEFNELMDFLIDKNIVNESEKAEYINTPKINKGFIHKIVEKYGDNNEVYNWLLENSYEQAEKSREREEAERYDDLEMKGKER